ncbi:TonB-dependent receptor [uncultured Algimonas sp.]|uniref:TonB-dependent siderophore receptor n=1 Tax=uncultured Algimonas sp. TaxID=1547920 RepID=UPI0026087C8F|nr:TonB-dependent receptor [uncultured Algimonas sp.]
MTHLSFRRACALGASLCALSSAAHAQSSQPPTWQADEIVVTGERLSLYDASQASLTRTPTPLIDVPQSIQVLTRTLLDEQELTTLSDALVNVSGAVPQDPMEAVLANPILRGFEAEIFVDGLIGYGDTATLDPSSLIGVERIEIAKGPTSVLFGGGTGAPVGGLINLVSKRPVADDFAVLGARIGSFGERAVNFDGNVDVQDGRAGFRLAGEWSTQDSHIDAVDADRLALYPSFAIGFSPETELLVRGQYSRVEQLEYPGLPSAVVGRPGVDARQFGGAADAPDTVIETKMVTAELTHDFGGGLFGQVRGRYYDMAFDEFASFPFFRFFPLDGTRADIIRGQLPTALDEATLDASLLWTARFGRADNTLLAGATYDRVDYGVGSGFDFAPIGTLDYTVVNAGLSFGAVPAVNSEQFNDYETLAAYVRNELAVGRWTVVASARLSEYRLRETVAGATGTDETYTELDPRLGLSVRITDGLSLFGGWAEGSRLALFFNGDRGQPPVPETSETVDGGVKFDMAGIGLSGTLAAFETTRRDIPVTSFIDPFASVQGGAQRSRGVEADLLWEPSPRLSVLGALAYTDAQTTQDSFEDGRSVVGNPLARIPDWSGRVAARYRWDNGLGLGAGLRFADGAPTNDAAVSVTDSYAVVDIQASYNWRDTRLSLSVTNLFDADYVVPYQYLNQDVVAPAAPIGLRASLSTRF